MAGGAPELEEREAADATYQLRLLLHPRPLGRRIWQEEGFKIQAIFRTLTAFLLYLPDAGWQEESGAAHVTAEAAIPATSYLSLDGCICR